MAILNKFGDTMYRQETRYRSALRTFIISLFALSLAYTIPLKTYGYFDLEAEVNNKDRAGKIWTFDQHHLNVINIFPLDQHFRLFVEMEWEHGISLENGGPGSGKIYLAQSWLEYKKTNAFRIQMGKILVPFGMRGLTYDATPTYLSSFLPGSVYGKHLNSVNHQDRLFAKWLTGIQLAGIFQPGEWNVEYFCYITNGRGSKPSEADDNSNKGLGGRLLVRPSFGETSFGLSYYSDADGTSHNTLQSSYGADATFSFSGFTFDIEGVYKRGQKINEVTETPIDSYLTGYGYYIQASRTFGDRWTPFVRFDRYDPDLDGHIKHDETVVVGINLSATPRVYIKAELQSIHDDNHTNTYQSFVSSIAVAF